MERERAGVAAGVHAGVVGALVMAVLALLALGVQATVQPLVPSLAAVVAPETGGDAVAALQVATVFGHHDAGAALAGRLAVAARDPGATHEAARMVEEVLRDAAAAADQAAGDPPGTNVNRPADGLHALPLAAVALLWVGGSAAAATLLNGSRRRREIRGLPAVATVGTVTVLGPAVVLWFAAMWDGGIPWTTAGVGYVALAAAGFTALQAAVLRLAGIVGLLALGLLYLVAAPLVTRPFDLLIPMHRVLLWFWDPSPFAVESWSTPFASSPPPLAGGVVVGIFLVAGLAVILWPQRAARPTAGSGRAAADGPGPGRYDA